MADLTDNLDAVYGPPVAGLAKAIHALIDAGDFDAARAQIERLGDSTDGQLARHHLGSILLLVDGRFDDAERSLATCAEQRPEIFLTEYAELMHDLGRRAGAVALFERQLDAGRHEAVLGAAETLMTGDPAIWQCLWELRLRTLRELGRHDDALQFAASLPDLRLAEIAASLSARSDERLPEWLEPDFCRILADPDVYRPALLRVVQRTLTDRIERWRADDTSLAEIGADPVLLAALAHVELYRADIEQFLRDLRKRLLLAAGSNADATAAHLALLVAVARQCQMNEYVYYCDDDEAAVLGHLAGRLDGVTNPGVGDAACVAAMLMYSAPTDPWPEHLPISALRHACPALHAFVAESTEAHARELELAQTFAAQASLADTTSAAVAGMYEHNPYPRWTGKLLDENPQRLTFADYNALYKTPAWNPAAPIDIESILVAGCGTGRHPLSIAKNYPEVDVTAIDISHRSLAYAQRMAERLGIENITFRRLDILELPQLGRQFDFVDSVGVIHHMRDPEAGLRALLGCLRRGGVIRLGLYSRHAREPIVRFREQFGEGMQDIDPKRIRGIRHELLSASRDFEFRDLLRSVDFYSLSGFRDLLLHVQESQFDLPEIAAMLARNDLHFLRFLDVDNLHHKMRTLMGQGADPYDLAVWHEAEQKEYRLFWAMYIFFAQLGDT